MADATMTRAELAAALQRYRGLVDDWSAFIDALRAPHVPCVLVNSLRMAPEAVARIMAGEGMGPAPMDWLPGAYRVHLPTAGAARPGASWLYQTGLYQVQEESSMLPVALLAPQPGDRVLDLCAAPGNKTAQIAIALGGRGTVIANDRSRNRLAGLHNVVSRLGLCNVTMTAADGCQFPMQPRLFDRVLVDAPCTSEGTARKYRRVGARPRSFVRYICGIQRALLRRALRLTRPGGRVVYSTCTFAPEENEMVVQAVLNTHPDAARLVPVTSFPGLPISPGVTSFDGQALAPEMARCARMWPHHTGTGGFFVAVLERLDADMPDILPGDQLDTRSSNDKGRSFRPAVDHPSLRACSNRFGIDPTVFSHLLVGQRGRYLRLTASNHEIPVGLTSVASGLAGLPAKAAQPRFTTAGVLAFGAHAQRSVIDLTPDESARYLRRQPVSVPGDVTVTDHRGYVMVRRHGGIALGNAQVVFENDAPVLASRFKNAWLRGPRSS